MLVSERPVCGELEDLSERPVMAVCSNRPEPLSDRVHGRYPPVSRHQSAGSLQYPAEPSSANALESRPHPLDSTLC